MRAGRWLLVWIVAVLCTASPSFAADIACAADTDASGAADLACPDPDKDNDGFTATGSAHPWTGETQTDCDDTNAAIFPNIVTESGCSANQIRRCKTDGSYTSCVNLSAAVASDFGTQYLNVYFFDPTKSADTGSGTYASPWPALAFSNTGLATYHAPAAGDVLVYMGTGNMAQRWSANTKMIFVTGKNGTSSNGILFWNAAGAQIVGQCTSPTECIPLYLDTSSYWTVMGAKINSGYSNTGIYVDTGSNNKFYANNIHDIDGSGGNNVSGIKITGGSTNLIWANTLYDNYDRSSPTNQNNVAGVTMFTGTGNKIDFNRVFYTSTQGAYGIKYKHGQTSASGEIIGNVVNNTIRSGIGNDNEGMVIAHNYIKNGNSGNDGSGIGIYDLGGTPRFNGQSVHHNTIINSSGLEYIRGGDSFAGGYGTLAFYSNVVQDDRATTYPAAGNDGFLRVCHYCDDTAYTNIVSGGTLNFHDNCYFNTASTTLYFDIFNDGTGSGSGYNGLTAFKAAGYDSGTYNENPSFDSYGRATSTNCADKGWMQTADEAPPATPTPTPTPTIIGGGKAPCRILRGR